MGYEYKNKKGRVYYLHSKGRLFYFSKDKKGSIDLPKGYKVMENKVTGLPMLKKA